MFGSPSKALSTCCFAILWNIWVQIPAEFLILFNSELISTFAMEKKVEDQKPQNWKKNQILHQSVYFLVIENKGFLSHKLFYCLPAQSVILSVFDSPQLGQPTPQFHVLHGKSFCTYCWQLIYASRLKKTKKASLSIWPQTLFFILHSGGRVLGDPAQSS